MEISRARLRTKTGCLTCRKRKKKCDEDGSACRACREAGRLCLWPSSAQLRDRRFASYTPPRPCLSLETAMARTAISQELEAVMTRHFMDEFYWLIILPDCHPDFMHGWIADMQRLMLKLPSLRYSIIACAAAHLHVADMSPEMEQLTLSYYAMAVSELSALLNHKSAPQAEDNHGVLICIILLYIQGCECTTTSTDIPKHVNAAARILAGKFFPSQSPRGVIERPFDRLAVESVIYQIFLATAGSWTDHSGFSCEFETDFWAQAEALLATTTLYPGKPDSINSPVLGIPVACFRLALTLKWYYQCEHVVDEETLIRARTELAALLEVVLPSQSSSASSFLSFPLNEGQDQGYKDSNQAHKQLASEESDMKVLCYRDSAHLYILISSLLLEQLTNRRNNYSTVIGAVASPDDESIRNYALPPAIPSSTNQIQQAMHILRRHEHDATWPTFYVGHWAVYTLGLFVQDNNDDIEVIRRDMRSRWERTACRLILRFYHEMEQAWSAPRREDEQTQAIGSLVRTGIGNNTRIGR